MDEGSRATVVEGGVSYAFLHVCEIYKKKVGCAAWRDFLVQWHRRFPRASFCGAPGGRGRRCGAAHAWVSTGAP